MCTSPGAEPDLAAQACTEGRNVWGVLHSGGPGRSFPSHPALCRGAGGSAVLQSRGTDPQPRGTDLNALDALRHHVGVMHPHQRDVHAGQPAQGSRPHACGESGPTLSTNPSSRDLRWSWGDSQMEGNEDRRRPSGSRGAKPPAALRPQPRSPTFPAVLCAPYPRSSPRRESGWSRGQSRPHIPSSPQNHQL